MVSSEDEAPKEWRPWFGPLALGIAYIAANIASLVVFLIVLGNITKANLNNPPASVNDLSTVVEEVGFVVIAVWVASWVTRPRPEQFGLRSPRVWWEAALIVPLGYLGLGVVEVVWAALINTTATEKKLVTSIGVHDGAIGVLAAILVTCVVAPICEEFLFRGFIFRALRNWRGPWLAALLTGILFGAVHAGSAPAVDLVPLGALGAILCGIRQWTGSLYPCIALHALNNSIALGATAGWSVAAIVAVLVCSLAAIALIVALTLRVTRLPRPLGST
jgi:membrane protease YdiL (CAAX protease family)